MNGIHNRVEWNYYDVISDNHLTNNICEGMNNRLMHRIGLKKASIYRVFQTLQSELDTAKNKVDTFCAGSQVKPYYRHRQTNTDQTRRNLKSQLETGNLDLRKYMRAMGALHSKTSLSKKKKNRTIHVATQEELAVTVTDGADPTVQIPSLPLLEQSQTQQRGGGRGRRRGRGQSRGRGSGLGRGRGRGRGSRMEQERGFVSQISSTDTESDDNVIETDSIDNDFDVSINLENVLLDVIELEQSVIERQVERDQEVQLGARKKRGRVFLSSSSSGSSAHKPMRNQPRMQDHLTQGLLY